MSLKGNTTAEKIWNFLIAKGLNEYGAAGLMGNLYAESALNPKNLQQTYEASLGFTDNSYTEAVDNGTYTESQFVNDSAGYGLAQWTYYTRKQNMYNKFKSGGYSSIGSIELACDFLLQELKGTYSGVLSVLKNTTSIREASDKVLHDFESPADQSEAVEVRRYNYSADYYNLYSGSTPVNPEPEPEPEPDEPVPGAVQGHKMSLLLMMLATRR